MKRHSSPLPRLRRLVCALLLLAGAGRADTLPQLIATIKPSVVGIGSIQAGRTPPVLFLGSGFVVGDGLTVLTAAHVVQRALAPAPGGAPVIGVLINLGTSTQYRAASIVRLDLEHDLARLRITGNALPALTLGDSDQVAEGQALAFTGFPLGLVMGMHHVTHRALVASIAPVRMPALSAQALKPGALLAQRQSGYAVFQLDATAYPGSSGSPLFDSATGLVVGVVNMVYVAGATSVPAGKILAASAPSGITYAIPANFARALLRACPAAGTAAVAAAAAAPAGAAATLEGGLNCDRPSAGP